MSLQKVDAVKRLATTWLGAIVGSIGVVIELMSASMLGSSEDLAHLSSVLNQCRSRSKGPRLHVTHLAASGEFTSMYSFTLFRLADTARGCRGRSDVLESHTGVPHTGGTLSARARRGG